MVKCSSSQLIISGRGSRKDSDFLGSWPLGVGPCTNKYMGNTNWSWYFLGFYFIIFGGCKSGRVDMGGMRSECG